ncbi:MAG: hypothetical protein MAGBODY4_01697 [Candidatus Marinimicrobia bacterium]|nr:hypothetical protein [Candidatus Neomarinimicrobiota bacterium]
MAIRVIGNPFPVRRPNRIFLPDAGRFGEVANITVLFGRRVDVAARLEDDSFAGWRSVKRGNHIFGVFPAWQCQPPITGYHNRKFLRFGSVLGDIQGVQIPGIFKDYLFVSGARPADVVFLKEGALRQFTGVQIIFPDVGTPGRFLIRIITRWPVRRKENFVTDPHRFGIGADPIGDLFHRVVREIIKPDVLGQSAGVPFPRPEIPKLPVVGDLGTITVEGGQSTFWQG